MKKMILTAALVAVICLTGCGDNMTIQMDDIPVVPAETTITSQTDNTRADGTSTMTVRSDTSSSAGQKETTGSNAKTKEDTKNTTSQSSAQSTTSAKSAGGSDSGNSGDTRTVNSLYGKWETVYFSRDTGGRVSYDLSDPVHKSYYVGLNLSESGQSGLTVGTESHPATCIIQGDTVEVCSVNKDNPCRMVFTVGADRNSMTVTLLNGKIIATLKRIQNDFSIKDFLKAATPAEDLYSTADLTGEWGLPGKFGYRNNSMTVRPDGTYILRYAAGGSRIGKIRIDKEDNPDSTVSCWYSFCDNDNTVWHRIACGELPVNRLPADPDSGMEFNRISVEDIAVEKMNNMNFLMKSFSGDGGDLQIDHSRTVTVDNKTYASVTDERFAINSLGRIAFKRLLEETVSGTDRKQWEDLIDESFVEQDGLDYMIISNAHGYYNYPTGKGVTITNQTDTSFTAETKDSNQLDGRGSANFVFDGVNWTIES